MAILNFDARNVAPSTGAPEAIPAGWYNAAIDQSEIKPTKTGDGMYLELRFNILDGQYVGRKLFSRINLRNPNAQAQEIGYKELSAVGHAVGVLMMEDSQQLHGIPLKLKVKLRNASQEKDQYGNVTKEYEASNDISAYRNINDPTAGAPATAAPAQNFAPPQAPAAAPAPWAQPAAPQPWAQAPAPAPVQQQAPQAPQPPQPAWAPQAAPAPIAPAAPPWQQQPPQAPAPQFAMQPPQQQAPAAGAMPPWAQAAAPVAAPPAAAQQQAAAAPWAGQAPPTPPWAQPK